MTYNSHKGTLHRSQCHPVLLLSVNTSVGVVYVPAACIFLTYVEVLQ